MMSLFIGAFYGINKFMKDRHRVGIIALALSIASPGSGFAYSAAYIRAWLTVILLLITVFLGTIEEGDFFKYSYAVILIVQAIWSTIYADNAGKKLRMKKAKDTQKAIEKAYLNDLMPYINSQHHLAVDTNSLMHFDKVLLELFKK